MKLFRNIRQNLLAQGRVTRRCICTIGEIVLLVIEILTAPRSPRPLKGRAYAPLKH